MHTFGEKSSFFSLTDGYDGRFIGGLPFAEALQHPVKAFHRFLRLHYSHLPGRGKHPAVEIAAEINGCLHAETAFVHDLRGNILPETVYDAVHQDVLTQQRHRTFLTVEHGEFLREELRYIKVLWPFHRSFIRDLHLNDAVNAELCDLLPMIVKADKVVCIVVPEHGKRRDNVDLPIMT